MRIAILIVMGLLVSACNNSSSGKWHKASSTEQSQLERSKAICKGRSAETQVAAGRLWIMGAVASESTFKACMAEQGFVQ
jgi:hypothetical protein